MSTVDDPLRARAERAGLSVDWDDVSGTPQRVARDVLEEVLSLLPACESPQIAPLLTTRIGEAVRIPASRDAEATWISEQGVEQRAERQLDGTWSVPTVAGYWQWQQAGRRQQIAVAPLRAFYPESQGALRHWGLAAQVYSMSHAGDGGIGDSSGGGAWVDVVARHGGDALALSPVHAAMAIGKGYSPYSPSDRMRLEGVHASPLQVLPQAAAAVRAADADLAARLAAHEQAARIDWSAAAAAKGEWIQALPAWLQNNAPLQWHSIAAELGQRQESFGAWLARCGWAQVHQRAKQQGLAIGLIADLAVGFDPAGHEAARYPDATLRGLELGAPPDAFNPHGQAWGITSYAPQSLRAQGYAPFIALLRAVMADRGGLRIDHILGLNRLWILPQGAGAGQGVYLNYPLTDLINLLVLESCRNRCLVIGEDLGVVPPGIRARLAERGILGVDVLAFSRDRSGFWPPSRWRSSAVAMSSTHDLPPVAGWLSGRDLDWQQQLGWSDPAATAINLDARRGQWRQLADLAAAQGLPADDLHAAALAITARSPAPLALLPLEDALALVEQPNLPGTVLQHPNWQNRLPCSPDAASRLRLDHFAAQRLHKGTA